ncbi:MAG: orotidine-5'-phosphate decarboxylase [Chloroflexi bacterium]|nr:orotidine-5'-phosphate decarboxylase [Chloroflexota bacterium]
MADFRSRVEMARRSKASVVCLGLDPRYEQLPQRFGQLPPPQALLAFNRMLIDLLAPVVAVVKPQAAFYELYGPDGVAALQETVAYAREKGLLVILDAKRGDIGSTAAAYAEAYLDPAGPFDADALTINGYLGSDGVQPFLDVAARHGKGVFVLVKTSNPSSTEVQDLVANGAPVYEQMAGLVDRWDCEAVVGGTFPAEAARARELMPRALILVPGYGAQGATADDVRPSFRADGSGAVVNNSRGLMYAPDPLAATVEMRDAINKALAPSELGTSASLS